MIDQNKELFEFPAEDLNALYQKMYDEAPDSIDYLLRRRAILNGEE